MMTCSMITNFMTLAVCDTNWLGCTRLYPIRRKPAGSSRINFRSRTRFRTRHDTKSHGSLYSLSQRLENYCASIATMKEENVTSKLIIAASSDIAKQETRSQFLAI